MFEWFVVSNNTATETLGYSCFFWSGLTINLTRQILGAAGFEFIYEKVCLAFFCTYSSNEILPKFHFLKAPRIMQPSPTSLSPKNCTPDIPDSSPGHLAHPVISSAVSTLWARFHFSKFTYGSQQEVWVSVSDSWGCDPNVWLLKACCVSIINTVKKTIFPSQDPSDAF